MLFLQSFLALIPGLGLFVPPHDFHSHTTDTLDMKPSDNGLFPPQVPLDAENYPIAPAELALEQVHVYIRHGVFPFLFAIFVGSFRAILNSFCSLKVNEHQFVCVWPTLLRLFLYTGRCAEQRVFSVLLSRHSVTPFKKHHGNQMARISSP